MSSLAKIRKCWELFGWEDATKGEDMGNLWLIVRLVVRLIVRPIVRLIVVN